MLAKIEEVKKQQTHSIFRPGKTIPEAIALEKQEYIIQQKIYLRFNKLQELD